MPPRKKTLTETSTPTIEQATSEVPKKMIKKTSPVDTIEQLRTQASQQINGLLDLLIKEINNLEDLKKKTHEELETEKRLHKQQYEQDAFSISMTQRAKLAEFEEKLTLQKKAFEEEKNKKEEILTTCQTQLDEKEKYYKELESQVQSFPEKSERSIEDAKKKIVAEMKKDFEMEKKLLIQANQSEVKLLQQKCATLQAQVAQLEKEAVSVKAEKLRALDQMKELAIAVVKGKDAPHPASSTE